MLIEAIDDDFIAMPGGVVREGLYLAADTVIAPPEVMEMLRNLAFETRRSFAPSAWWIVHDGEIVGLCSVIRVSPEGDLHIGYGVAPSRQGRGFATKGVRQMLEWALHDPRVTHVSAETGTENVASQRVLESNGFLRTGERIDADDGRVIGWQIQVA